MSFPSIFNCPSCTASLRPGEGDLRWLVCGDCGAWMENGKEKSFLAGDPPPEDVSVIRPGTRGSWEEKPFVVTGRIRYEFDDESYVNWWHVRSRVSGSGWLAEAYGTFSLLFPFELPVKISAVETLRPGDALRLPAGNFVLQSFSPTTGWSAEGELPERPAEKNFMWIDFSGGKNTALDIHIYDRQHIAAFTGNEAPASLLQLTNTRLPNGWTL